VNGACLTLAGHTSEVHALTVLPDGKLVSGSDDTTVRVWDVATGECVSTFQHSKGIWCLEVMPEGKLASGSFYDGDISVWENGKLLLMLRGHASNVQTLVALPGGMLASCSQDHTVRVWR
jgi:WD40 repeat protein